MSIRLLRPLLICILTFATAWGVSITWWHTRNAMPTSLEVVSCLLVVPALLLSGFWVLRKLIDSFRTPAEIGISEGGPANEASVAKHVQEETESARCALSIIASAISTPVGDDCSDVWSFLAEGQMKQDLDEKFLEDIGSAVFAARCPTADIEAAKLLLSGLQGQRTWEDSSWHESELRALSLLLNVCDQMVEALRDALACDEHSAQTAQLRVYAVIPASWAKAKHQQVDQIVASLLAPAFSRNAKRLSVVVHSSAKGAETLSLLDKLQVQMDIEKSRDFVLVLAIDSAIDSSLVEQWLSNGSILSAQTKGELIPGEAAAALLLRACSAVAENDLMREKNRPVIHRMAFLKRRDSADRKSKVYSDTLKDVAQNAMAFAQIDGQKIASIVSDADRRVSRQGEILGYAGAQYAAFDLQAQCLSAGLATGYVRNSSTLIAVALASSRVQESGDAVMVLSVEDEFERAGIVILPPAFSAVSASA